MMAARQKISEGAGTAAALSVQGGIFTLKEKQKWQTRLYGWLTLFFFFFFSPNWGLNNFGRSKSSGALLRAVRLRRAACVGSGTNAKPQPACPTFDSYVWMWWADGFSALRWAPAALSKRFEWTLCWTDMQRKRERGTVVPHWSRNETVSTCGNCIIQC